ncbi:hypothetical protein [Escherichia coli]|nr:hypothetical protein [Escherichia coli]
MKARVLAVLRSLEHKVADYPHLMLTSCTGVNAKIIGRFSPFLMSAIGH